VPCFGLMLPYPLISPAIKLNSVLYPGEENGNWGNVFCCAFTLTSLKNTLPSHPAPGFPLWLLIKPLTQMTPLSPPPICTLNNAQTRVSTETKNNSHSHLFFLTYIGQSGGRKIEVYRRLIIFFICP